MTMIERLGNVLYWAGCILGALIFVVWVIAAITNAEPAYLWLGLLALPPWLLGLAARYVLAGGSGAGR